MLIPVIENKQFLKIKHRCNTLFLLGFVSLLVACASSGPVTKYYSFFAVKEAKTDETEITDKSLSFGVGPIIIPEYMDNPSIVSVTSQQQVRVSGQNAWAGDLKAAMGRVLADNLSQYWLIDSVSAFPWDNRVRPKYQLRLVFDEFGGERGGDVHLRVSWTLLNQQGDKIHLAKRAAFSSTTGNETMENYVSAMNDLLNQLSYELAFNVNKHIQDSKSLVAE